nr:hypothetical protein CFP56_50164 [Quercus suber]
MSTKYSKENYARVKGMKNEQLSQLAIDTKKHKLNKDKNGTAVSSSIHAVPSSPTPSLEVMNVTSPTTRSKGKSKIGKSFWEDPVTSLGRAHNVIIDEELKGLAFIPSHELVSHHIHKLVLVLGESLHLTTDYLSNEEKVLVANSKVEFVEVESSKLRKDLFEAMSQAAKAKEKVMELNIETINTKILADEAREQEEAAIATVAATIVGGDDATDAR